MKFEHEPIDLGYNDLEAVTGDKGRFYTDPEGNKSNSTIQATINDVEVFVPLDNKNSDYQQILKWVEEGNTIEEAD